MAILVSNIKIPITASKEAAFEKALKTIRLTKNQVGDIHVHKVSVDARKQENIQFVYTIEITDVLREADVVRRINNPNVKLSQREEIHFLTGSKVLEHPPVITGFGPAGMFAGLVLAQMGYCPIILERGEDVDNRVQKVESFWQNGVLDTQTNVQFGEGGAGTFSDGKLTTRISDPRCSYVLEQLVRFDAPEEILHKQKPHIGTDNLRQVVKKIRRQIIELGGQVLFGTQLTNISLENRRLTKIQTNKGEIPASCLILAIGHSARDTFSMLMDKGVFLEPKAFSVGARIEHRQEDIDQALYGSQAGNPQLPVGEYQLSYRENGRGVYTFCMCPGGVVVPAASEENMVVTNGMSEYARNSGTANAAVVVSVDSKDYGNHPLKAIAFQRQLERAAFSAGQGGYKAPLQTVGDFLEGRQGTAPGRVTPSYARGWQETDLHQILPAYVTEMMEKGLRQFGRKMKGYDHPSAVLTGVETRTSSPVRITRGENLQSISFEGIYPCGEGAGYAGGIISAAVDGIRVAQAIMEVYKPLQ